MRNMIRKFVYLGLLLLVMLSERVSAQESRKNILMVLVDDLKPTMGVYGDETAITPYMDKLSDMGMRFDNAYCNLPSVDHRLDGTSLKPIMEDPDYEMERPSLTYFIKASVGMRTKDWRYIWYYDGTEELYDSNKDPKEWNNIAEDPEFANVKADFQKWLPKKVKPRAGS